MEAPSFLRRPQEELNIVSWNINSAKTKTEKTHVESFLSCFDIICLNEIKTDLSISFSGYVSYTSYDNVNANRGGTCVLVKYCLNRFIYDVNVSIPDQIWFKIKCFPGVLFGACYVPPSDSVYFNHAQLSSIQEMIKCNEGVNGCVLLGDLNARFGVSISELPERLGLPDLSYPEIPDPIQSPNDNATAVLGICSEERMLVINNLKTPNRHFKSKKTFKKGQVWISELDTCIVSECLVKCISNFDVIHDNLLPSDHAPITMSLCAPAPCLDTLRARAEDLGKHGAVDNQSVVAANLLTKRPLRFSNLDSDMFLSKLGDQNPIVSNNNDMNTNAKQLSNVLYDIASACRIQDNVAGMIYTNENRWNRILDENDQAKLWSAINWRGEIHHDYATKDIKPSDKAFQNYFETLYNQTNTKVLDPNEFRNDISIPVLDEIIAPDEVINQINKLKPNKSSGPDGLPPGLFKLLPVEWILNITTLFNNLFLSGLYPESWSSAKLFAIFKKGSKAIPSNYRGINVIDCIAKIYDMVLAGRLSQWFKPCREQAGSQAGRGCVEHIVTLRLFMDIARRKKLKLFVTFVDYSKAYDTVPRHKLFQVLKNMGCGATMILALIAMYQCTNSIIGTAMFAATIGVRQGSPTSCILFIIYVDVMVKMIKQGCLADGFLKWLHVLVLMDDTVLLATSKDGMKSKLKIMYEFCKTHGMIVNNDKTKFMVINGNDKDREPIILDDNIIMYRKQYISLGSPFTDDGSPTSAIKIHANIKVCHVLKFISFLNKNNDVPFIVKKKIFNAALMSAVLYGCESWLNGDLKPIDKLYKWSLKQLLGVRKSTSNDACLLELGMPPLRALVRAKQRNFFSKMWLERNEMTDDPLMLAIESVKRYNDTISRLVVDLTNSRVNDIEEAQTLLKTRIENSESNRISFYKRINPSLDVHNIYCKPTKVNEIERISWTRLRLSSHSLAIETGRWNRRGRGRLPVEERLCQCGYVQTEDHVIEVCPLSLHIRQRFNITTVNEFMVVRTDHDVVCSAAHKLLALY